MLHGILIRLLLSYFIFRLESSVFSILQRLGNFLRCIPGEDGSSSPIHYTSVFSDVELDLPIDWFPIIVVFEIQTLVATQSTHTLNFFALRSSLKFPLKSLLSSLSKMFLGDLIHKNRIFCDSSK